MEILEVHDATARAYILVAIILGGIIVYGGLMIRALRSKTETSQNKKTWVIGCSAGIVVCLILGVCLVPTVSEQYTAKVDDVSEVYEEGYKIIEVDKDTGLYTLEKRD